MNNDDAAQRKRKRLEAWRKKQQQQPGLEPKKKVSLSLANLSQKPKVAPAPVAASVAVNPFADDADDEGEDDEKELQESHKRKLLDLEDLTKLEASTSVAHVESKEDTKSEKKKRKKIGRWDNATSSKEEKTSKSKASSDLRDALDQFMDHLQSAESTTMNVVDNEASLQVNVSGSMIRSSSKKTIPAMTVMTEKALKDGQNGTDDEALYQPKDWLSDVPPSDADTDDEADQEARRALVEALKSTPAPKPVDPVITEELEEEHEEPQTSAQRKSEQSRRAAHLQQLQAQAEAVRRQIKEEPNALGRMLQEDTGGVMEEAERHWLAAQAAPNDALQVLQDMNKKKELRVDHSKIQYDPFVKNLYRVPSALVGLSNDDVMNRRAKLKVRVRGHGAPAPVSTFEECGLSDKILSILQYQKITKPFPVQAQCVPCIMGKPCVCCLCRWIVSYTHFFLLSSQLVETLSELPKRVRVKRWPTCCRCCVISWSNLRLLPMNPGRLD